MNAVGSVGQGEQVRIAVASKPGGRPRNEDACGVWRYAGPICCVLADGAGGHGGGDVASRLAVDAVLEAFGREPAVSPRLVRALLDLANGVVMRAQSEGAAVSDMRTTLVVLTLDPESGAACWGHIGDSRLYCFRGGYVAFRTKDHSLLQSLVDAGLASVDDVRGNAQRTVLTGSVGGTEGFVPDVPEVDVKLRGGDALLLCSDGFWEALEEREMESALQSVDSPEAWIERMEHIIERVRRPGQDNYSAIALWFGQLDFSTQIRL